MRVRRAWAWVWAVGLALAACAGPTPPGVLPPAWAGLAGVWCNPAGDGRTCWAYDEFRADGHFAACGRTDDDPRPFHAEGRYRVDGSRLCYEVARASANFWLPPGARYCTELRSVDARTHRYRDLDTGAEFELTRVTASQRRCDGG